MAVVAALVTGAAGAHAAACSTTTFLYVSPNGEATNSGADWSTPKTLQGALTAANGVTDLSKCFEIRVQQGVYKPAAAGARATSFAINRPLQLKGGYTGSGDTRGTDPALTVLSGDIDGNDTGVAGGITPSAGNVVGNNSYHVVVIGGTSLSGGNRNYGNDPQSADYTLLDGFTVTGGRANISFPPFNRGGGGLVCNGLGGGRSCSPAINAVQFVGNTAQFGGAMIIFGANGGTARPVITQALFSNNAATASGGAINNSGTDGGVSSPVLTDTRFVANAADAGGALYNDGTMGGQSMPVFNRSSFNNNTATDRGGAIVNDGAGGESGASITASLFDGNRATKSGGAVANLGGGGKATLIVRSSTFKSNQSTAGAGGAIVNDANTGGSATLTVDGSTFNDNQSFHDGGAILNDAYDANGVVDMSVTNSTFSGNQVLRSDYWGGAISTYARSAGSKATIRVAFSTFDGNSATLGQAIASDVRSPGAGDIRLTANVFARRAGQPVAAQVHESTAETSVLTFNLLPDPWTGSGDNNLAGGALLGPLQDNGGPTQTLLPGAGSPAIDSVACDVSGTALAADQRGTARPQGARCDRGAVEVELPKYALAVTVTGAGTVQPDVAPVGAATAPVCPTNDCSALPYLAGTSVQLTAAAATGYVLQGWGGACTSSTGATCTLTMSEARAASASFLPMLTFGGALNGSVTCTAGGQPVASGAGVPDGTSVQCTAVPVQGFALAAWSGGACAGTTSPCQFTMAGPATVGASFAPVTTLPGTTDPGGGTGTDPAGPGSAGIEGGGPNCRFDEGASGFVAPTEAPPPGKLFPQGWFKFKLIGCNAEPVHVSITWPKAVTGYTKWGKPNGAPNEPSEYFTPPGLQIQGQTVSFTVQDGGPGDDDGPGNGTITDLSGPVAAAAVVAVPSLGQAALLLLGLLAAALGGAGLRRRPIG